MIKEILLASVGATGFAIIFGLPKNKLYVIAMFSGVAWWMYLLLTTVLNSDGMAMFSVTIIIVLLAKMIGKKMKCPAFVIATPILIPFIPGATLYLVMNDFVGKEVTFILLHLFMHRAHIFILNIAAAKQYFKLIHQCLLSCSLLFQFVYRCMKCFECRGIISTLYGGRCFFRSYFG